MARFWQPGSPSPRQPGSPPPRPDATPPVPFAGIRYGGGDQRPQPPHHLEPNGLPRSYKK
jgi:hypothetical protein